ncbi:UNVERIFIED_CONTAM: hypothetical protein Sradi_4867800 [Sesamum radiatum]|uniref:Retrotransposon gag domain-containing protein n=1 Tax=Sesamum radiatum TaxID=300843 RepID=A0AAW2MYT8_SESRA
MENKLLENYRTPAIAEYDGTTDPQEHLSRFENTTLLHRYTDGIKCRIFITTFVRAAQQWFNQLPAGAIGSFQEVRSLFLHQFTSSRKLKKTEIKGDFFKSLAKKPVSKFDALLLLAAKYINIEDAQAAKKESRGEKKKKKKEEKEEIPSKKPQMELRDRKTPFQRVNAVYTPLTVPITPTLMVVEGKGLLAQPKSWKDGPHRPKFDKNSAIFITLTAVLMKNAARGTGPYQKREGNKGKEAKTPNPESFPKQGRDR